MYEDIKIMLIELEDRYCKLELKKFNLKYKNNKTPYQTQCLIDLMARVHELGKIIFKLTKKIRKEENRK